MSRVSPPLACWGWRLSCSLPWPPPLPMGRAKAATWHWAMVTYCWGWAFCVGHAVYCPPTCLPFLSPHAESLPPTGLAAQHQASISVLPRDSLWGPLPSTAAPHVPTTPTCTLTYTSTPHPIPIPCKLLHTPTMHTPHPTHTASVTWGRVPGVVLGAEGVPKYKFSQGIISLRLGTEGMWVLRVAGHRVLRVGGT